MTAALAILSAWALWEALRMAYELCDRALYALHAPNCVYCHSRTYAEHQQQLREWRLRARGHRPYWKP